MRKDIIHLNGHMHVIDNESKLMPGDVTLGLMGKIIATTDPSLGLPLLPAIEENTLQQLVDELPVDWLGTGGLGSNPDKEAEDWKKRWDVAYKAAKAKQYTEEDMRKAFIAGRKFQQGGKSAKEQPERNEPDFTDFIQYLNPKPVAVELEMKDIGGEEWMGDNENGEPFWNEILIPRVENGFVKVKQWYYE